MNTIVVTFILFLLAFIAIGVLSVLQSKKTTEDYLIAGRSMNPYLASISAAATNTSGYMFIGLIGFTYKFGISSIWVTVGWISGDYLMWRLAYKRFRQQSENNDIHTVPGFIGSTLNGVDRIVVVVSGLITLVLLSIYASAQLNAGSKALHVLFQWHYSTGAIIGAVIVFLYCMAGGIRASIWTDVSQAFVMIFSMALLLGTCVSQAGGPQVLFAKLHEINPTLINLFPDRLAFGIPLYVAGWFFAGLGVMGQPHMQIRTMSIKSPENMTKARRAYFAWYIPFSIAAVGVGLYSRVLLPNAASFDPELALPSLALAYLPDVFVGLILAGLFAATMSTADSLILSSGAALTQDVVSSKKISRVFAKIGTLIITVFSLVFALYGPKNVFELVTIVWSGLGAAFGPVIILRIFRQKLGTVQAILMMVVAITTVVLWRYVFELTGGVYEIMPGMLAGCLVYIVTRFGSHVFRR